MARLEFDGISRRLDEDGERLFIELTVGRILEINPDGLSLPDGDKVVTWATILGLAQGAHHPAEITA